MLFKIQMSERMNPNPNPNKLFLMNLIYVFRNFIINYFLYFFLLSYELLFYFLSNYIFKIKILLFSVD